MPEHHEPESTTSGALGRLYQHVASIDAVERSLRLAVEDARKESAGWRVLVAVDFAELHAYAYRISRAQLVQGFPSEDEVRTQSRGDIALAYLFSSGFPQLVQLPPYVTELREYVQKAQAEMAVVSAEVVAKRNQLKKALQEELSSTNLLALVDKFKRTRSLTSVEANEIAGFALNKFKEAYAWLRATEVVDATERIIAISNSSKFIHLSTITSTTPDERVLTSRALEIHDVLLNVRGNRSYQSFVDGLACAWVEFLNETLRQNRTMVLLVTHSPAMHRAIDERIQAGADSKPDAYLRDLNYCLTRLAHETRAPEDTLANLERSLQTMASLSGVHERIRAAVRLVKEKDATASEAHILAEVNEAVEAAESSLPTIRRIIEQRENSELMLNELSHPLWDAAASSRSDRSPQSVVAHFVMQMITDRQDDVFEALKVKSERLLSRLSQESDVLAESTRKLYFVARVETVATKALKERIRSADATSKVVFASLPGEPPLVLAIRDDYMRRVAKAFERLRDRNSHETVEHFRSTLVRLIGARSADVPEAHFLLGYVLASLGDWEAALDWLASKMPSEYPVEPYPLVLLRCVVLRRLWRNRDAMAACIAGLERWPNDPAILRECASVIWQTMQNDSEVSLLEREFGGISIDRSIAMCQEALRRAGDVEPLKAQIMNTLAYLLAERNANDDLRNAIETMRDLARMYPRKKWIGRFFDTEGTIFVKCASVETDVTRRRELLAAGIESLTHAMKDGGVALVEKEIIGEHLRQANEELMF